MEFPFWSKKILIFLTSILICYTTLADENLFQQAKILQRERTFDEAIVAFRSYLSQPLDKSDLTGKQLSLYVDALVQLMKTFQSKGDPESCISTLQGHCLRDFHSVMGYALFRMEKMKEAEETMMKALSLHFVVLFQSVISATMPMLQQCSIVPELSKRGNLLVSRCIATS